MGQRIKLIIMLMLFASISFGQNNYRVDKSDDLILTRILNGLTPLTDRKTDELTIRIYTVSNSSGSAGQPTGEVTHQLYIAVSEHDEQPAQNLFIFGPLFNPKTKGWTGTGKMQYLELEHGTDNSRQTLTLSVELEKVEIMN